MPQIGNVTTVLIFFSAVLEFFCPIIPFTQYISYLLVFSKKILNFNFSIFDVNYLRLLRHQDEVFFRICKDLTADFF